jgi:hypothetical protein
MRLTCIDSQAHSFWQRAEPTLVGLGPQDLDVPGDGRRTAKGASQGRQRSPPDGIGRRDDDLDGSLPGYRSLLTRLIRDVRARIVENNHKLPAPHALFDASPGVRRS